MKRKTSSDLQPKTTKKRGTTSAYKPVRATTSKPYIQTQVSHLPAAWQPTGAEIKAIDIAQATQLFRVPGTGTNIDLLNGIQSGAGFFSRIGSRVELKNLHIRGMILTVSSCATELCRMLIVYDRQPVGSLPNINDILQSRAQDGTTTNTGSSEVNLDNRDRFIIVRDMQWYMPAQTFTAGVVTNAAFPGFGKNTFEVNEFIKLKGLGTHFKSSNNPTTIADIASGALYVAFVSSGGDSDVAFYGGFRLRYEDK